MNKRTLNMNLAQTMGALATAALLVSNSLAADAAPAKTPSPAATPAASAAPAPTASVPAVTPALPAGPLTLEAMDAKLDEAVKQIDAKNSSVPDLYAVAKSRILEAQGILHEDPKSKNKASLMESCSLLTEAALTQIQAELKQAERVRLQDKRIAALVELNTIQDDITKLERGYSSSLKADLEEQKRKAQAAKDEAEKRFGELNSALIQVHKDARGTIISMSDILFDVGKATLTSDLKINLAKIAGILTIYKDANVEVEGHTDNQGSEELNQKLSEKRASNVMDYLVTPGGVDAKRLTSVGYGFTKPVADNATKEGRQKNRRVDLVIMDKKVPATP